MHICLNLNIQSCNSYVYLGGGQSSLTTWWASLKKTLCTTLVIPILFFSFHYNPNLGRPRCNPLTFVCMWSGIMEIYMMRSKHVMTLSSPSWGGRSLKCEDCRWSHHQLCTFLYDIIPFLHVHAPLFIVCDIILHGWAFDALQLYVPSFELQSSYLIVHMLQAYESWASIMRHRKISTSIYHTGRFTFVFSLTRDDCLRLIWYIDYPN